MLANDVHVVAGSVDEGEILCYATLKSAPDAPPGTTLRTRDRALLPVEKTHGFGIFNIDIAAHGDPEKADGFLPVDHRDHPRLSLLLKLIENTDSGSVRPIRSQHLLDNHVDHNQPKREFPYAAKSVPPIALDRSDRLRVFVQPLADVLCFHIVKTQLMAYRVQP